MITESEIKSEVEMAIFGELEYPMEDYFQMQPLVDKVVCLVRVFCDISATITAREIKYGIRKSLEEEVSKAVDAYAIAKPEIVQPNEPFEGPKTAFDELMSIDI